MNATKFKLATTAMLNHSDFCHRCTIAEDLLTEKLTPSQAMELIALLATNFSNHADTWQWIEGLSTTVHEEETLHSQLIAAQADDNLDLFFELFLGAYLPGTPEERCKLLQNFIIYYNDAETTDTLSFYLGDFAEGCRWFYHNGTLAYVSATQELDNQEIIADHYHEVTQPRPYTKLVCLEEDDDGFARVNGERLDEEQSLTYYLDNL